MDELPGDQRHAVGARVFDGREYADSRRAPDLGGRGEAASQPGPRRTAGTRQGGHDGFRDKARGRAARRSSAARGRGRRPASRAAAHAERAARPTGRRRCAALLAVALVGIGIVLSSSPERTAHRRAAGAARHLAGAADGAEFYTAGSKRCVSLGFGSSVPCYTLGASATGVASEWGLLSVSDNELALGAMQDSRPGVYRWHIQGGALRLAKVRDPVSSRARASSPPRSSRHPASGHPPPRLARLCVHLPAVRLLDPRPCPWLQRGRPGRSTGSTRHRPASR